MFVQHQRYKDILPDQSYVWQYVENNIHELQDYMDIKR